jgi:hypothetical protein
LTALNHIVRPLASIGLKLQRKYRGILIQLHGQLTTIFPESPLDRMAFNEILIIVLNFIYKRLVMVVTKSSGSTFNSHSETRCECGQLIAKVVESGLELKCKRCKRIVTIPFASIKGWNSIAS